MKLDELIAAGALINDAYQSREVTWNGVTFTVDVKSEMSPADWESIYVDPRGGVTDQNDKSILAKKVSRMVRLDGEPLPFEVANRFKVDLLQALAAAVRDVEVPAAPKDSRPSTTSGTNSSSPESAAEQSEKPSDA